MGLPPQPDGQHILSFNQAQTKVRTLAQQYRASRPGDAALIVRSAVEAYFSVPRGHDQHLRLKKHVLGAGIANQPLAALTEAALIAWRQSLPGMLSPATVQRIATDFRAALNLAAKTHRKGLPADFGVVVQHGLASREPTVSSAREPQILQDSDIRRLVAAAWEVDAQDGWGGDLGRLVLVLAATGARFSQIVRMTVSDVQAAPHGSSFSQGTRAEIVVEDCCAGRQ